MDTSNNSSAPNTSYLRQTVLVAVAMTLAPVLLGTLFVLMLHAFRPAATPPSPATNDVSVALEAETADLDRLLSLRREHRRAGLDTEELNVCIWAAQTRSPAALLRVPPPDAAHTWKWLVSQDGLFSLAVSSTADSAGRRAVALRDLASGEWRWKAQLPWPDAHEPPYVLNKRVVVRYAKNARNFAMEIDESGAIRSIDPLGKSPIPEAPVTPRVVGCPGTPVAIKNGIYFAADAQSQELVGFSLNRIPGLRFAGRGDAMTVFSGNGLLKFSAQQGQLTVSDSLTQTVLQRVSAWHPMTNTTVTGALSTRDGSRLSVFLKTAFGGHPPQEREWSISLDTYNGSAKTSFNADALLTTPHPRPQRIATTADTRWLVSVGPSNVLSIASRATKRELARVELRTALGPAPAVEHIAFLEDGRHLVLRQAGYVWLLDFDLVRGYADLRGRLDAAAAALREAATNSVAIRAAQPPQAEAAPAATAAEAATPAVSEAAAPSDLALTAELLLAHQVWLYAAASLEACAARSASDGRAPRVNPLLLARAHLLAGQPRQARLACRDALGKLVSDSSEYNRMIRYQLQGLLFASP